MNRVFLTPAAVALCGASSLSLAEPVSLADQVVTATRTAQTASQSLAAVSVIDREDIERSQARSVPELLRQVPGVSLANNGGFGKNTTLFLRGTESPARRLSLRQWPGTRRHAAQGQVAQRL